MGCVKAGVWYCLGAYVMWALFPLYFKLLTRSGAFEIIASRILFSFLACLIVLAVIRHWRQLQRIVANRRLLGLLALGGLLVAINWTTYVYGVNTGRTLDAALGYFINPLVAAALGVLLLKESLTRLQWLAFGVGFIASVVLIVGYGKVPWIAFALALSFGTYGLVKKRVGGKVPALEGCTIETGVLAPLAIAYLVYLGATGAVTAPPTQAYGWLVYLAGPITLAPLLLFAAGAARVTMVTIGMVQYVAPIGQFLVGWLVFDEPMPLSRWIGFFLVWISVALFTTSALAGWRAKQRALRRAQPASS